MSYDETDEEIMARIEANLAGVDLSAHPELAAQARQLQDRCRNQQGAGNVGLWREFEQTRQVVRDSYGQPPKRVIQPHTDPYGGGGGGQPPNRVQRPRQAPPQRQPPTPPSRVQGPLGPSRDIGDNEEARLITQGRQRAAQALPKGQVSGPTDTDLDRLIALGKQRSAQGALRSHIHRPAANEPAPDPATEAKNAEKRRIAALPQHQRDALIAKQNEEKRSKKERGKSPGHGNHQVPSMQNPQGNPSMTKRSVQGSKPLPDMPDDEVSQMIAKAKARRLTESQNPRPKTSVPDDESDRLIAKAKARQAAEIQKQRDENMAEERAKKAAAKAAKKERADALAKKKEEAADRKAQNVKVPKPQDGDSEDARKARFNNLFGKPNDAPSPSSKQDSRSSGSTVDLPATKSTDIEDDEVAQMIARAKARRLAEGQSSPTAPSPPAPGSLPMIPKPPVSTAKQSKERLSIGKRAADTAADMADDEVAQMIAKAKARRLAEGQTSSAAPSPPAPGPPPPFRRSHPEPTAPPGPPLPYQEEEVDPDAAHQARLARLRAAREAADARGSPGPEMEMEREPEKKPNALARLKTPPPPDAGGSGGSGRGGGGRRLK
jgi:hypothetical protein